MFDCVGLTFSIFYRYGSPGNVVNKEYQQFAEWYLPTFTGGILEALLKVLDQYRNKIYVSPRVLTEILKYIKTAYVLSVALRLELLLIKFSFAFQCEPFVFLETH